MGSDRVQVERKSSSTLTPGFKPKPFSFLQPRYQDKVETDSDSFTGNKQQNSSEQSNPTTPFLGHSLGRMSVLPIQAKLSIGPPNDKYEQEADRVADRVMRMSEPKIQRVCPECEEELQRQPMEEKEEEEETVQTKPLAEQITPLVQRQIEPLEEEEEEETLQTKTTLGQLPTVSSSLQTRITALQGGGQPLPQSETAFFEPRFSADFSQVRIHSDNQAAETARAINARAFTVGPDVVFGTGQYESKTTKGRRLLAHELTHVVQQQGSLSHTGSKLLQRQVPQDITAQVGPVSGQGGLIHDSSRKRMSIIVGPNDTLRTIARRLLPIWNNAQPFTPPGTSTPRPVTQLTEEQLAKGLIVYNRDHLAVPSMTEWKVGLRFPLPIEVNRVNRARTLNPDLITLWANNFDSAWLPLLDISPAATVAATQATLEQLVQTFLQETQTLSARGIHLSARAMRNAREAEPFIQEVFRQAASESFDLALAFMDRIVIHQFDLLASQTAGQEIIDTIRNALANAPTSQSPSQQQSLARANRLLNRLGVFSTETAERFRDIYVTEVPGCHCMAAVYHGLEGLFSEGVSRSIQDQVGRESREVMRRTGRDTNHMDRIMETVRARGMAGSETQLVYQAASNTWQPAPEATVLGMTHPSVAGWYFFGLSLHGAYHSVILAVDKTDPANPHIYWMDQFSHGFTNDVTGTLMNKMRRFRPSYGFAPSRLWQIIPAADTLIVLD